MLSICHTIFTHLLLFYNTMLYKFWKKDKILQNFLKMSHCQKKIDKFSKPSWFHHLTTTQIELLDELAPALSNDSAEACTTRSSGVIRRLRLYPRPSPALVTSSIRDSDGNSVMLLEQLRNQLKSERRINYNEKLLMSSVCYFELPLFLSCLSTALTSSSAKTHKSSSTEEKKSAKRLNQKNNSKDRNPYKSPVWCRQPDDWLAKRNVGAELAERAPRRIMDPPEALSRTFTPLSHIRNQAEEKKAEAGPMCFVLQCFQNDQKTEQLSSKLDMTQLAKDLPRYSDIRVALPGVVKFLADRGMICCLYPKLLLHPVIQQFVKNWSGEVLTRDTRATILDRCKSAERCMRELYTIPPPLPVPLYNTPDATWQNIEQVKRNARSQRRTILDELFRSRYAASQNFARSLQPEFKMVDGFLPVFAAYTINSHTEMTVWPPLGT